MMSEKEISEPEQKKEKAAAKKKATVGKTVKTKIAVVGGKVESEDFKTDLTGEIKPARKRKISEKSAALSIKKSSEKIKSTEISEPAAASEAKPRRRKTAVKENSATAVNAETPAKKNSPKTARTKTSKTEILAEDTSKDTPPENSNREKLLPPIAATATALITEAAPEKTSANKESVVFKELAAPKLPVLEPENRARLQIQSPTKLFFYWSLKSNPFEILRRIFGGHAGEYTLVVKLQNQTGETENIFPIDASGSTWFDVESGARYRAEVGFSAPRRPFVRLLFSNTVETPRSAPSPVLDSLPQFAVTAREFAEVLDVSGYRQDAFEVALTSDNIEAGNTATFNVFEQLTGEREFESKAAELRLVLFALASDLSLSALRGQISMNLFTRLEKIIQENAAQLSTEKVLSALEKNFGLGSFETENDRAEISYSVFGASRINFQKFPKQLWKRFTPGSSLRVGR